MYCFSNGCTGFVNTVSKVVEVRRYLSQYTVTELTSRAEAAHGDPTRERATVLQEGLWSPVLAATRREEKGAMIGQLQWVSKKENENEMKLRRRVVR